MYINLDKKFKSLHKLMANKKGKTEMENALVALKNDSKANAEFCGALMHNGFIIEPLACGQAVHERVASVNENKLIAYFLGGISSANEDGELLGDFKLVSKRKFDSKTNAKEQ